MTGSLRPVRLVSIGAFFVWLPLAAIQYDYVPFLEHAWGFNLWRYLPDWAGWLLLLAALLVTTEETRRGLLRMGRELAALGRRVSPRVLDLALLALVAVSLWVVRERHLYGDSMLLASFLGKAERLAYPETGGQLVLRGLLRGARGLGLPPIPLVQAVSCLFGAGTVVLLTRAARLFNPGAGTTAAIVPLLVFSAGLTRAVAGRVEVQPAVLLGVSAYLLLACRVLSGSGSLRSAAVAAGLAAWISPLCVFLLPSLLALPWLAPSAGARPERRAAVAFAIALVPLCLHAAGMMITSPESPIPFGEIFGGLVGWGGWVRGWGGAPSIGTDYVLLSLPHLKYLGNAAFVLAPAAVPVLLGFALAAPRRILATPARRFLAVAALPLVLASIAIRPLWGPFDWDLFAATALLLACLAGALLADLGDLELRGQLAAALIGLQIFHVGLPLAAMGVSVSVAAGPFAPKAFAIRLANKGVRPPKRIAP